MMAVAASTSRTIWTTLAHGDAAQLRPAPASLRPGGLGRRLAQAVDVELGRAGGRTQITRQRGRLDERQRPAQLVRSQGRSGGGHGAVGPDQDGQADQHLGVVGGQDVDAGGGVASVKSVRATTPSARTASDLALMFRCAMRTACSAASVLQAEAARSAPTAPVSRSDIRLPSTTSTSAWSAPGRRPAVSTRHTGTSRVSASSVASASRSMPGHPCRR